MRIRDYFRQNQDGSWEPTQPVTIQAAGGSVSLAPGARFIRGTQFMGVDIAELCDRDAYV